MLFELGFRFTLVWFDVMLASSEPSVWLVTALFQHPILETESSTSTIFAFNFYHLWDELSDRLLNFYHLCQALLFDEASQKTGLFCQALLFYEASQKTGLSIQ